MAIHNQQQLIQLKRSWKDDLGNRAGVGLRTSGVWFQESDFRSLISESELREVRGPKSEVRRPFYSMNSSST